MTSTRLGGRPPQFLFRRNLPPGGAPSTLLATRLVAAAAPVFGAGAFLPRTSVGSLERFVSVLLLLATRFGSTTSAGLAARLPRVTAAAGAGAAAVGFGFGADGLRAVGLRAGAGADAAGAAGPRAPLMMVSIMMMSAAWGQEGYLLGFAARVFAAMGAFSPPISALMMVSFVIHSKCRFGDSITYLVRFVPRVFG